MSKEYSCIRCGFETTEKRYLVKHLCRKTICDPNLKDVSPKLQLEELTKKEYSADAVQCQYCDKRFNNASNRYKHMRICKKNMENVSKKEIINAFSIIKEQCEKQSKVIKTLEKQYKDLVCYIKETIEKNTTIISKLQTDIEILKTKKSEKYYQHITEKFLGGTHKKVMCGITDISTDNLHAEIKHAKDYKDAIGQITCYNQVDPKPNLHLYLFGKAGKQLLETAKHLCSGLNIKLFIFTHSKNIVNIVDCFNNDNIVYTFREIAYEENNINYDEAVYDDTDDESNEEDIHVEKKENYDEEIDINALVPFFNSHHKQINI